MSRKIQFGKKSGFTIVELLTVMSVIVILIGLLVPSLNKVKQYAREVKQRAQFHSIDVAMELFETEHEGYPDSDEDDSQDSPQPYCGAMKLAEAMVGQDLLGYHKDSMFRADFRDALGKRKLYQEPGAAPIDDQDLKMRMGPYIQLENANATRLIPYIDTGNNIDEPGIWTAAGDVAPFANEYTFVLCDVYTKLMKSGYKVGMPILYYKANPNADYNPNKRKDNFNLGADTSYYFYDYKDNDDLVKLDNPWNGGQATHPMASDYSPSLPEKPWEKLPVSFYYKINNDDIPIDNGRPYRSDSYILISAGYDGLYGTSDDIFNFQK